MYDSSKMPKEIVAEVALSLFQRRRYVKVRRSLFLILVLISPLALFAQGTPEFPTDNEITTLMQQANLSMKQYQVAMLDEATKVGKDADSKQNEKNAFENWQLLMPIVKTKPDNFNSGVGFMVVDQLNNAYQDALTCVINAQTTMGAAFVLKDESHQNEAKAASDTCLNAAQLLAIVKVSATNLYTKYLQAHKVLYERSLNAVATCTEAMKKVTAKKP
jgi:hypothetical protein